jgi:hypothetical protein
LDQGSQVLDLTGEPDRETIQGASVRVCRDSGFKLAPAGAAIFVGRVIEAHSLSVWMDGLDFDQMERSPTARIPSWRTCAL